MSSVEQLKTLAEKRRKMLLDARVFECVIVAGLVWFFCGWSAFGVGLLITSFMKACGIGMIASFVGCFSGFSCWAFRVYRQVTEQVNAEFAERMAEAKTAETSSSWPQFIVPTHGNAGYYIRRESEETAYIVRKGGEAAFGWGVIVQDNMEKGQYKVVTESEAKAVLC